MTAQDKKKLELFARRVLLMLETDEHDADLTMEIVETAKSMKLAKEDREGNFRAVDKYVT
jgi:hypothetical protein